MTPPQAARAVEVLLESLVVIFPDERVVRAALDAATRFQISWYDAHMLSFAEVAAIDTFFSEDLQHGRTYGRVRVINPFQ